MTPRYSIHAKHWGLDPEVIFLNHGSFGATPRAVLEYQRTIRDKMESEPVRFFISEYPELLLDVRNLFAEFIGVQPQTIVFVRNVTYAVNSVLRSYPFQSGDELLITNLEYNACTNVAKYVAKKENVKLVTAQIPFPFETEDQVIDAVLAAVTPRTRLVMIDHITSATGFRIPIEPIIEELNRRGIDSLIDGSHSVGMVPLELDKLGATFFTSNAHKWLCAPKGAAFLYTREDAQDKIYPASISHGYNMSLPNSPKFHDHFDWAGTDDFSSYLSIGESIKFMESILPNGWGDYIKHNNELIIAARKLICERLGCALPCPDKMLTSLATIPLPDETEPTALIGKLAYAQIHPIQAKLYGKYKLELPVWHEFPKLNLRISACLYNDISQYEALADALQEIFHL
ncbi:MAG: aminotransferase class V-fold PLP-dependent enzyme [Thermoguttaceae bacterium]